MPGRLSIDGTPVDLTKVTTPTYVQAGREDHIAPAASVWKITHHFKGPLKFVLAGSGHIAGVVNPPAAGKYQYWINDQKVETLAEFIAGARETKGSWWPDWAEWIESVDADEGGCKRRTRARKGQVQGARRCAGELCAHSLKPSIP